LLRRLEHILSGRTLFLAILIGSVLYLTLIPLFMILYGTFRDGPPGSTSSFTLMHYVKAYSAEELPTLAINTVVFAIGAATVSFVLGTFLAWATERTNTPLKGLIYTLVLFPFVIPGILTTISWVLLLSPQIGFINWVLINYLGFSAAPLSIYTMPGMIWAFGIDNITLPFFLMAASFRSMDPSLEEAAHVSGMNGLRVFWHVNVKLMLPSILAIWLLLFIRGIETFEVPAVIGIPAEIKVFASQIFLALTVTYPPDYNLAATHAVLYLLIAVIGVLIYLKVTSTTEKYTTITGKAYRPRTQDLRGWRYPCLAVCLSILLLAVVVPFLMILWVSLLPYYGRPSRELIALMTLKNYWFLAESDIFYLALRNNVVAGTLSATLAALLSALIAWVVVRTKIPGRKLLDLLSFTPIAIPGVVMGLALIWFYLSFPVPVYGTLWILVIAYVTKFIPISLRACHSSMLQIHPELEEASVVSGSSEARTFFRIVLPLMLPGLVVGWFYVLTLTFKVLSLPVLLSHVGTQVLPMVIFDLYRSGKFGDVCALGTVLIVILAMVAALARLVAGRLGVHER
jgi:iron(III) transport system permease protein